MAYNLSKTEKYLHLTGKLRIAVFVILILVVLAGLVFTLKARALKGMRAYDEAVSFLDEGEPQHAESELLRAVKLKWRYAHAYALLGEAYVAMGRDADAVYYFKKALKIKRGKFPPAAVGLARLYFKKGDVQKAEKALTDLLAKVPDFSPGLCLLGQVLEAQGRDDEALAQYEKAKGVSPEDGEPLLRAGLLYLKQGRKDLANKEYIKLLDYGIGFVKRWEREENALFTDVGNADEVLTEQDPVMLLIKEARRLANQGAGQEAVTVYMQAYNKDPANTVVLHEGGALCNVLGLYDIAEKAFRAYINLKPKDPLGYCFLGQVLANTRRIDEGIKYVNRSLVLDPDYADSHFALGIIYLNRGDNEIAAQHLKKASTLLITNPQLFYYLGIAYYRLDMPGLAQEAFKRTLSLAPDHKDAHRYLALAYEKERTLMKTKKYFKVYPHRLPYLMAVALYKSGRYEEAMAKYDETLHMKADYTQAKMGKAMCLHKLGQQKASIQAYKSIIDESPDFIPAKMALAKIYLARGDRRRYEQVMKGIETFVKQKASAVPPHD